jgi:purine nucleosidase
MGDSRLPRATRAETQHAVDAIVELAACHAGELEIISLGPLTNLAVAIRREPSVARQVKAITR